MEVGVRLVGIILRILNFLALPACWLRSWRRRTVPPIKNNLLFLSVKDLAERISNGHRTSVEVVSAFIERVEEVNPYINAVVEERFRDALEEAANVDTQIKEAREKGTLEALLKEKPLLGLPFTVKESCSLAGMSNSVGCLEKAGSRATADGAAVALVRAAGAIPLLVSSTPELCLGWETTSPLRGATNNPYCLARTPAGSSGGEAALVCSGASPFSVASDIAGSIRLPAAFCGVFGHKPTPGVIPIEGHIPSLRDPLFPRVLSLGPLTRRAADLPLLLRVLAGPQASRLRLDQPVDVGSLKVFYMTEAMKSIALIPVQKCIVDAIHNAVAFLEKHCGCTISEEKFEELEDSVEISISVFFSMTDIPNLLQDPNNPNRDKSLALELARCAVGCASRSLQALSFALIHRTRLFIPHARTQHYTTRADQLRDKMTKMLGDNGVFIYPVFNELAHHHNQVFLKASGVVYTMVFNVLGMPATSVPIAMHHGLPVSIQVIAAPNQDRLCLAVAKQLESGFGGWRPQ